jgi:5-methylcytosine-specific restriction endonuclease McrA
VSRAKIHSDLRKRIAERDRFRCAYCMTSRRIVGPMREIDHIVPLAGGGSSLEEYLCLACPMCNGHKADRISGQDPESGLHVRLYHPRLDPWRDHFEWSANGTILHGRTPIGRATVAALENNHAEIVGVRRLWVAAGWHPPAS